MTTIASQFKAPKYRNKKVPWVFLWEDVVFDSQLEKDYSDFLHKELEAWRVKNIKRQVNFILQPSFTDINGNKYMAIKYVADFTWEYPDKNHPVELVVVDVKWQATKDAILKYKLFKYTYPNIYFYWTCKFWGERVDWHSNEERKRKNRREKKRKQKLGKEED